jgi:hypothetical protein
LKNSDISSGSILRELSLEGRATIIDMRIEDVAFRELLKIMLQDHGSRPTAA